MTISTFLDDLSSDLEKAGFGTKGVDIFHEGIDKNTESGISLNPYSGPNPTDIVSGEENFHNPFLNVFVRDTSRTQARSIAFQIYEHWRLLHNITIGNTHFLILKARSTPQFAGLSKNLYPEYTINFELKFL